jgi:flagellar hook-basal body complex protein FliE
MAVESISGLNPLASKSFGSESKVDDLATKFGEYLMDAINKTNDLQLASESATSALATGQTDNVHAVMIAAEKADLAMQFTMQVKNKILDAYQEIMRMQV